MNQISYAASKKQILTFSKTTLIRTTTFWLISSLVSLTNDQVYSNTRVPTQVNTNQHESTRVWHESARINTSLTRFNTSQQESKLVRHESKASEHESDASQHESSQVKKCPRWVNISQHKSDTSLTQVNLS